VTAALAPVRFAEVLHVARLRKASDIHLRAGRVPVLRVDGELETYGETPASRNEITQLAETLLPERAQRELERCGDASATYRAADWGRLRVHAYRTTAGVALAMRLLEVCAPALESLQLPSAVDACALRTHGLVIFAGPTGSGKSTALAALVDRINRTQTRHILTIEDPVEYEHDARRSIVDHRELGDDVPSFDQAVYSALRSDPDVILVGEMRNAATMHAALTAAETGHLVLTTLHTGDAPQTIDRIVGAFGGGTQDQIRVQLAQTLASVICLRLVPRASGSGRRCAAEVLTGTDAARNLIREGKTHQLRSLMETSRSSGMQTLQAHLDELVRAGEISPETARRTA
jgi:twitching motility protein PilT